MIDNATINASGETGGGTVLVGGDYQGKNPDIPNAFRTYVGPNAMITADAVVSGDGGKVIVWSDDTTRAYGSISAKGGAQSGNGGFVEVSGKQHLEFDARVDVAAPRGTTGTLLLDPGFIIIDNTSGPKNNELNANVPTAGDPAGSIFFADGGTADSTLYTITDEAIESQSANIVLQAARDITVNPGLSVGGLVLTNPGQSLTLQARRHIIINSPIITNNGAIILEADSPHTPGVPAGGVGVVRVNAAVSSNGGHITLIGGGNASPTGGFVLGADVNAGAGGINVGLSSGGTFNFFIGAGGNTQLSSNDTGFLKTTGALVLGQAATAGTNGLGAGAVTVTVTSITNATSNPMVLSPASGSSFRLVAGSGGILLDRALTTFQNTVIETTGTLTIKQPLSTSNNDLTITASNVTLQGSGSINTGSGTFSCAGVGCPPGASTIFWTGNTGLTPGDGISWFDSLNWSGDFLPTSSWDVTIGSGVGTISINGAAAAKSLVASSPVQLSGGSLTLANASSFSHALTLSGGSLQGMGSVTVGGANGALTWSGGSMASGGTFFLGGGRSGTLSNALTLNRLFDNSGTLTLSNAVISGIGSINNASAGTISTAASTANTINVPLTNLGTIQLLSSLTTASFPVNSGTINFAANNPTLSTGGNALTNATTGIIAGTGTLNLGAATLTNQGTLRPGASPGTLNITGNLTMTSTSVTDIEVRDPWTTAGTDFDVINVTGIATLAGTLNITHFDGLTPPNNQQMQVISATGGVSGTFGSVNPPFGSSYTTLYGGNDVNLKYLSALAINEWATDLSGDWNTAGNWSLGVVPTTSHAVRINRSSGSPMVTMGSITHSILQLFNAETLTLNSSTLNLADSSSNTGTLNLNSSTLGGTGTLANQGTVTLSNATISSPFDNQGMLVAANNTINTINGAFTGNTGTIRVDGSLGGPTSLTIANGFTNAGTIELESDLGGAATLNVSAGTLTNNNVIRSMGVNANSLNAQVTNPGTIELFNSLSISNFPANAGTINLAANNPTLSTGGNPLNNAATGIIQGNGTVNLGGATLTNNGAMRPGATPGKLAITGDLGLSSTSVIDIELGGLTQGVNHDWIQVSGSAALNGTLNVTEFGGFRTNPGNSFQVITCTGGPACRSGTFGTVNVPTDVAIMPAYNAVDVTLSTTSVTDRWVGMSGGWEDAGNWSRGVPTSTTDVVIDIAGSQTVTVSTGAQAARTLTSQENLMISGGSLSLGSVVADATTINGTLDLSGGTLQNSGSLTVNGAFNWNAGALTGTGNLTVAGGAAFNVNGNSARTLNGLTVSAGHVNLNGGSLALQSGTLNASGLTTIANGATLLAQGGTLNAAGGTMDIFGTFQAGGGVVTAGTMNVRVGGTLNGTGTVIANVNNVAGTVAPGTSPGTLTINGNYMQGPAGWLTVDIGGTAPGTQYDQLIVTGNVMLDGTLNVAPMNNYVPAGNEIYTIIQSGGTVSGTFATTNLPSRPTFLTAYFPSSVNVAAAGAPPAETVVASTEQSTNAQTAATSSADPKQEEEKRDTQKKPVCTGSSSGGGVAAARPVMSGGAQSRCTARGCF